MADNAQTSIGIALATGGLVWALAQSTLPPLANVRQTPADNKTLQRTRRTFTWMASGLVGLVYWLTKDPVPVIVGGTAVVALDVAHRHADAVNHASQTVVTSTGNGPTSGNQASGLRTSASGLPGQ